MFTRAGPGMGGWVERDLSSIGKKESRIAKNCKESQIDSSGACFDSIELMPNRPQKQFCFTRPEIGGGADLKDDFPPVLLPMHGAT
jgi:hypothetical protein